uniref:G protein-coupled receptor 137B n=1 Tax=Ailuropoda melanoleuca TaxID=9646 RepID=A0A7N5KRC9_AILME
SATQVSNPQQTAGGSAKPQTRAGGAGGLRWCAERGLGLTIVYTVFYSLLFVFIYVQLWLALRYRHKRLSYQSVFLFLCLFWASLRTVLFSFYFRDFVAANALGPFVFWLLYCFPVCLQFFTLTLMNLYFTQVSRGRHLGRAHLAVRPPPCARRQLRGPRLLGAVTEPRGPQCEQKALALGSPEPCPACSPFCRVTPSHSQKRRKNEKVWAGATSRSLPA